jgi:MFS family permease
MQTCLCSYPNSATVSQSMNLATATFGLATAPWQILIARAAAWLGRGVRTPVRKALLAAAVNRSVYGRAFGFERTMDTLGAIVGPLTALWLLASFPGKYRIVFALNYWLASSRQS